VSANRAGAKAWRECEQWPERIEVGSVRVVPCGVPAAVGGKFRGRGATEGLHEGAKPADQGVDGIDVVAARPAPSRAAARRRSPPGQRPRWPRRFGGRLGQLPRGASSPRLSSPPEALSPNRPCADRPATSGVAAPGGSQGRACAGPTRGTPFGFRVDDLHPPAPDAVTRRPQHLGSAAAGHRRRCLDHVTRQRDHRIGAMDPGQRRPAAA
jgi:hypothetical protein